MCLVHGLDVPKTRVIPEGRGAVDPRHRHPVTRLHLVNQVTVGEHDDGVGRLSGRHVLCHQSDTSVIYNGDGYVFIVVIEMQ